MKAFADNSSKLAQMIGLFVDREKKTLQNANLLFDNINFNSFPNDKILDGTKLKAFADEKVNVAQMMISLCYRVENTVGKGESAGSQHFLLFPQCFP